MGTVYERDCYHQAGVSDRNFHLLEEGAIEQPIRWVEFIPIKSKRPGSKNLSLIRSHIVGTAILFSDIDPGPYHNGRRYLAPVNDYHQRSAALSS
ncbi:hypothetical protein EVAR_21545_1 [Eumeta japonica]|uniref:Uncharacterized protein n=1 Tax=Eumeta variegata TaxID=151549 RepID=A0A4C1UZP0_EUMVA|nr:hypothetical protein EVAR_21545_1 [Eumeta japonica]